MKKILLLVLTVVLTSSCAELFCDMFNYSKEENSKDKSGAGDDIYAVDEGDVNAYVICKSGWSPVYWCAPHTWSNFNDYDYRPRFWAREATVTPYPASNNPLVYICQYPSNDHCASWEVIASDKRVLPVLMAGDGGFPFAKANVMALLDEYVSAMAVLKESEDSINVAALESWDNIRTISKIIYENRQDTPQGLFYPGYWRPAGSDNWNDVPQWITRADERPELPDGYHFFGDAPDTTAHPVAGHYERHVQYSYLYLKHNTFDPSGWGVPLKNPAAALFNGAFPVDGYKWGYHYYIVMWHFRDCAGNMYWKDNGNPLAVASEEQITAVTYYCLLPETTGCSNSIWCVDPNDWFAK